MNPNIMLALIFGNALEIKPCNIFLLYSIVKPNKCLGKARQLATLYLAESDETALIVPRISLILSICKLMVFIPASVICLSG